MVKYKSQERSNIMPPKTNEVQNRLQNVEQTLAKLLTSNNQLKDDYAVLQSNYNNLISDLNERLEDLNRRVNTFQK